MGILFQPQQSKLNGGAQNEQINVIPEHIVDEEDDGIVSEMDLSGKTTKTSDRDNFRQKLLDMQALLFAMRQRYVQLYEAQQHQRHQQVANALLLNPIVSVGSSVMSTQFDWPDGDCDTELDEHALSEKAIK